jgi:hypothetical protein
MSVRANHEVEGGSHDLPGKIGRPEKLYLSIVSGGV